MIRSEYKVGQLLAINKLVVEVCAVGVGGQCSNCAGFNKKHYAINSLIVVINFILGNWTALSSVRQKKRKLW